MKTVKHADYPTKTIPDESIDKFLSFGWDELPQSQDVIDKQALIDKEFSQRKQSDYLLINRQSVSGGKKTLKEIKDAPK